MVINNRDRQRTRVVYVPVNTGGGSQKGTSILNFSLPWDVEGKAYFDLSNISGDITRKFQSYTPLLGVDYLYMPLVTNFSGLFLFCSNLEYIKKIKFADGAYAEQLFLGCTNLAEIPDLRGYNLEYDSFFQNCQRLTTIPAYLDFTNKTWVAYMCNGCTSLQSVPEYDWTTVTNTNNTFQNCISLTDLGGFIGLKVNLDLSSCPLTHDSIMNVINKAADVTASPVTLTLGSTNLAKLTDEEKAIATSKGWTLA